MRSFSSFGQRKKTLFNSETGLDVDIEDQNLENGKQRS